MPDSLEESHRLIRTLRSKISSLHTQLSRFTNNDDVIDITDGDVAKHSQNGDILEFGSESTDHITRVELEHIRTTCKNPEEAIQTVTELLFFSPERAPQNRNVYVLSTKQHTAEIFRNGKWRASTKFQTLEWILKQSVTLLMKEWTLSTRCVTDMEKVHSGNLDITKTLGALLIECQVSQNSAIHHRCKRLLWTLLLNHGKRPK
jgi:hypothetical protein